MPITDPTQLLEVWTEHRRNVGERTAGLTTAQRQAVVDRLGGDMPVVSLALRCYDVVTGTQAYYEYRPDSRVSFIVTSSLGEVAARNSWWGRPREWGRVWVELDRSPTNDRALTIARGDTVRVQGRAYVQEHVQLYQAHEDDTGGRRLHVRIVEAVLE